MIEDPSLRICVLGAVTSAHTITRAKIFLEYDHDVFIVTPTDQIDIDGIKITACPRGPQSGFFHKLGWLFKVFNSVRHAKADIFHAHYAAELTTWMAALLGKKKLIVTVMGGDVLFDEQGSIGPVGRWLTRFALKKADLITVKSALLADVVREFGIPSHKIVEIVWGVDHRKFKNDPIAAKNRREKWKLSQDKKIIYSPRMLTPFYNQELMLDAFVKVQQSAPESHLVFSTYNEDLSFKNDLIKKSKLLGIENAISFVPAEDTNDMVGSYCAADLVLSLAPSDGTPQSVMEAMACHTPVIMTDLKRYREFFKHKETAWFVKLNADDIAGSILDLLNDTEMGCSIIEKAALNVRNIANLEAQAELMNSYYMGLLQS